jgi:hypothetical protein
MRRVILSSDCSSRSSSTSLPTPACAHWRAELGTDRAAGAGDQHRAFAELLVHQLPVEGDRLAAEQVLDRDLAQLVGADVVVELVGQARDLAERQPGLVAQRDDAPHLRRARRGHGDHQQARGGLARDALEVVERAEHLDVLDLRALEHGHVVEQARRRGSGPGCAARATASRRRCRSRGSARAWRSLRGPAPGCGPSTAGRPGAAGRGRRSGTADTEPARGAGWSAPCPAAGRPAPVSSRPSSAAWRG